MRQSEANKLPHGVYRVFWVGGGEGLASVGSTYDGTRWLAPTNWVSRSKRSPMVASTKQWGAVRKIEPIALS